MPLWHTQTVTSRQTISPETAAIAEHWIGLDPDEETRDYLATLLANQSAEVNELFAGRIGFGTAGLRAQMGPGPTRMNSLVVRQTTAGLMRWLEKNPFVVVGFDARRNSDQFARDVVGVVAALGGRAAIVGEPVPTPVLANAVLDLGASAGIMITASHNPAADNGYKLYLRDGIQLVSPADAEIADAIAEVVASDDQIPFVEMPHKAIETLGDEVLESHLEVALGVLFSVESSARELRSVYTAMHGVGGAHFVSAMAAAGFTPARVVQSQFHPDPLFPTVQFPNPEEAGAMDEAFRLADDSTNVIVAHDPDADRLSLALPARDGNGFTQLSGDQVGMLLADYIFNNTSGPRVVASSVVSSRMLGALAVDAGVDCVTTLTGFKWVARPMIEQPELHYVLGYEEALGYAVSTRVRDKDGITAGLMALEMVAVYNSRGETLWDRLDTLTAKFGLYLQRPVTVRLGQDSDVTAGGLLASVLAGPPEVEGVEIAGVYDMNDGYLQLPPTVGAVVMYSDQTRVIVRPSGTEPKVKIYIEVIEPSSNSDLGSSRINAFESAYSGFVS
jgi:phosphomannomutase